MTKDELVRYVLESPENTNPNVFRSLLDQYISENGGGSSGDGNWENVRVTLINSYPEKSFIFYNPFSEFSDEVFTETTVDLPIPKGSTLYLRANSFNDFDEQIPPVCTGNIVFDFGVFAISGDGTITLAANKNMIAQ